MLRQYCTESWEGCEKGGEGVLREKEREEGRDHKVGEGSGERDNGRQRDCGRDERMGEEREAMREREGLEERES